MKPNRVLNYEHADVYERDGVWVTNGFVCDETVVVQKALTVRGDLRTKGNLIAHGNLFVEGSLEVAGNVQASGSFYVNLDAAIGGVVDIQNYSSFLRDLVVARRLTTGGRCVVVGNAHLKGGFRAGGEVEVGGNLQVDGWFRPQSTVEVAGELLCLDLYWSRLDMPAASKMLVCRVLPVESQAEYWRSRLDLEEDDMCGCYDDIIERLLPSLPEFLARGDLAPVERWMLESHSPANRISYYERWEELRDAAASAAKESIDGRDGHQQEVGAGDAAPPEESGAI